MCGTDFFPDDNCIAVWRLDLFPNDNVAECGTDLFTKDNVPVCDTDFYPNDNVVLYMRY